MSMWLKRILISVFILSLASSAFAAFPPLNIREEDGTPSTYPYRLKFPNTSVTDNGDSTTSIDFIGGALPTTYLKLDGTNVPTAGYTSWTTALTTTNTITAEQLTSTDDADITDNLTAGDIVIDEAAGVLNFSGATSATITSTSGLIGFGDENLTTTGTITGINVTSGADPGHTHTGTSLSSIDISSDTNLAVSTPITLTGDSVGMVNQGTTTTVLHGNAAGNPAFSAVTYSDITAMTSANFATLISDETGSGKLCFATSPTFLTGITLGDSSGATFVLTSLLSGATDPTLTFANNSINLSHDLIVDGGDIGLTADTNLLQISANLLTLNGDFLINPSSGIAGYKISDSGTSGHLVFQNQVSSKAATFELFSKDGDGTDGCQMMFWGVGTPAATTNSERMLFGWASSLQKYQVATLAGGTGVSRPIVLYTAGNTNQLELNTDGTISLTPSSTQAYTFGTRSAYTTALTLQGQSSATSFTFDFFAKDGDGTDALQLNIFGVGTPAGIGNRERLSIGWDKTNYTIYSEAEGTGTLRSIILYTEGNTNQFRIETNGTIWGDPLNDQFTFMMLGRILDKLTACKLLLGWFTPSDAGTEVDYSGAGHNGTYTDASNWTATDQVPVGLVWGLTADNDDQLNFGDSDDFSFGNGTTDSAFSMGTWYYMATGTANRTIMSKWSTDLGDSEWWLYMTNLETISFIVRDDSAAQSPQVTTSSTYADGWYFIVLTYDPASGSGATFANGISIYINGVSVGVSRTNKATYVAMENQAIPLWVAEADYEAASNYSMSGTLGAGTFITKETLSAENVWKLYVDTKGFLNQ